METRQVIKYTGLALLGGAVAYGIYSTISNRILYNKIIDKINNTSGFDDVRDFSYFSGNDYIEQVKEKAKKKGKRYIQLKQQYVNAFAKKLHDNLHLWYGGEDEKAVINTIAKLKDGVQIAQVSIAYLKKYNSSLKDEIIKYFDKDELQELTEVVKVKKPYRLIK